MPLAILPFDSVTLRGMSMVKNHFFESVVQMYKDDRTGAGHIKPGDLRMSVGGISGHDINIIKHISELHSFDVYSLRIALRKHGINVNDSKYLKLSPTMQADLETYVRPFTARLIRAIYGDEIDADTTDVGKLLKDADPHKARHNLKMIASKIQIDLAEVPQFLEDYGDIYLSISYYKNHLDALGPLISEFVEAMNVISANTQLRTSPEIARTASKLVERVGKMQELLYGRFQLFSQSTDDMWNDMNAEKFGAFKCMVEDNYAVIGGVLCKLTVKMDAWHNKFPSHRTAGANRLADYLMTDMRQGF